MKIYYCDICSCQIPEERKMIIPMRRFDGKEDFVIQCKDNCGFRHADICKRCENRIKKAIQEAVGLGHPSTDKTESEDNVKESTELYFDDREMCKFCASGACYNANSPYTICDGYDETCRYRDMEKKTLAEAIVKESED